MKKIVRAALLGLAMIAGCQQASAFDLKDLLGGNGGGNTIGNLIEGVFMKSDLTTRDLMGVWTTQKPAVAFKGDNFLKQAGGVAAASAIESKLNPYFNQLGLNGATLTVNADSTFTLKSNKLNMAGSIRQTADGNFIFAIKAFGKLNLGEVPAYVQKTSTSMDVMFDTTKLKTLVSSISKFLNMKSLNIVASILDSNDGLYIGFGMTKTGNVQGEENNSNSSSLLNILNGRKDSTNNGSSTTTTTNTGNQSQTGEKVKEGIGNALKGILNGKKK